MILAVDSSTLIAFGKKEEGKDIELFADAMLRGDVRIPPAVVTEVLSNPNSHTRIEQIVQEIESLPITAGYWRRAGVMRCAILRAGFKARLADALIAQACIDHKIALITRDKDFRHFVKHGGLKLA